MTLNKVGGKWFVSFKLPVSGQCLRTVGPGAQAWQEHGVRNSSTTGTCRQELKHGRKMDIGTYVRRNASY